MVRLTRQSTSISAAVSVAGRGSSRDLSQGLIFALRGEAERTWKVDFRQEVVLEAAQRMREGTVSAPGLNLGHRSAVPVALPMWKERLPVAACPSLASCICLPMIF